MRLPAVLQAQVAYCMSDSCLLHPLLPPCFLDSVLSEARRCDITSIEFDDLSKAELQALSRQMIGLPQVTCCVIGCTEPLEAPACAMDRPGAALCHMFLHLPGLLSLYLRVHVSEGIFLGDAVPLPAALRELDLTGSVLEHYMGRKRGLAQMVDGARLVLHHLSRSLKHVEEVILPADEDGHLHYETPSLKSVKWERKVAMRFA